MFIISSIIIIRVNCITAVLYCHLSYDLVELYIIIILLNCFVYVRKHYHRYYIFEHELLRKRVKTMTATGQCSCGELLSSLYQRNTSRCENEHVA